jgi:shikimate dehydrogenase
MLKKYAVLGNPIAHSKSPQIHYAFAQQFNIKLSYERILVPLDGLASTLITFQQNGGYGVNITVPFKIEAAQLNAQKTERAAKAGAVNTIVLKQDGWLADNTDGIGLLRDLTQNNQLELANKNILILGAGGSTQGILFPLLSSKPHSIVIANRTLSTAEKLAAMFNEHGNCAACALNQLPPQIFDLIINATSAGVKGEALALPNHIINQNTFCYDLVYGAPAQSFLNWAQQNGAKHYCDGIGMLVEQAAEAFYIWHNVRPETKSVIELLKDYKN